jgi:hypothetical protein
MENQFNAKHAGQITDMYAIPAIKKRYPNWTSKALMKLVSAYLARIIAEKH